MPRTFIAALALIACGTGSGAFAQSPDYGDGTGGGEAPRLIMPGLLTSPLSSGVDADGYGAIGAPAQTGTIEETWEAPYSVEGEEQLEPSTN